jgi:ATP-dependent protease ClpP protease subunit
MSYYKIKAKGNKSAEISIYGDIGESWWNDESITAKQFCKDIAALDVDSLIVRINSYGGSVSDGIAIYNALKRHKASITVAIDGVAISIASLIAMSGDTVEMAENALMMIHAPWSWAEGNANDMRKAADVLDTFASAMSTSYANKTGKSKDDVMAWLTDGEDHWFTAAEAQAENLIDTIVDAQPISAQFNLNRFKTIPAAAGIFNKPPKQENPMPDKTATKPAASAPQPAEDPRATIIATPIQPSAEDIKAQAMTAEKQRRTDIRARFAGVIKKYPSAGLDKVMEECLDDPAIDVKTAVEMAMNKLGEGVTPTAGGFATRVETGETDNEKFARAVGQAIMARCGFEKHDSANEFKHMNSLKKVAQACLERAGVKTSNMDDERMIKAALMMGRHSVMAGGQQTLSDFPVLMENVMHRQVLTAYNATPDTWSQFCAVGSVSDFREWQRLRVGSIGDIDAVNEAGEYKHKVIPDAGKEVISVQRRGNIIGITPEVIINDDIGYISTLTTTFGRAAKRTIETQVYAKLAANPTLKDGKALFHTAHGNLAGSGAIPSVDTLEAARVAMAKQKDIGGNEFLDIRPAIWLGGLARGGDVRVIVGAQYDPDTANKLQKPNKVNGIVQNIVDTPRISGTDWYLFADPGVAPVLEVVFLNGQSEPQLAMEENFATAGVNYRVELPFGVGAIGYEGAYKNPGAAS